MNRKVNYYIMIVISFLQGMVFYGPVATIYRQGRGLSMYQIFLIESVNMILMIAFEIPWGWFADKFGYKTTLVISYFIFFISKIVFYEAYSFDVFLLERVLMAICISGISGCDTALIYLSMREDESEKAFGMVNAAGACGLMFASMLSVFIVEKSVDLTAFYTIFPYAAAAVLSLFLKSPEKAEKRNFNIFGSIKNSLKVKDIFILVFAFAVISETTHGICVFLNQEQYVKVHIPIKYFGLLSILMQAVCMISMKSHVVLDKIGRAKSIISVFGIVAICSFILSYSSSIVVTIICIAVIEGAFALSQPIISSVENDSIRTFDRATILSIYAMVSDLTGCGINYLIGRVSNVSLPKAFMFCGILSAAALILASIYFAKNHFARE